MRAVVLSKQLAAASVNAIALAQSLAGAGNFTLNGAAVAGGVAALDTQRRVLITSAGNDSGITFTVFGTSDSGTAIQETVTGANAAAVATNQDFATVTRVAASGATASTVQIGTNPVGSSRWLLLNPHVAPASVSLAGVLIAGAATWEADYTYDDFLNLAPGAFPQPFAHQTLVNQTGTADGTLSVPVKGVRLTITSGTGTVQLTVTQSGIRQS
jgi:hypothetical protein